MNGERDILFERFALGLFIILLLYGFGMGASVLFGDENLAARMLTGFATMFSGVLGLGSGYLLGSRTNGRTTGTKPRKPRGVDSPTTKTRRKDGNT